MARPTSSVRIDPELKKRAVEIFETLGIDLSSAINMFLNQTVLRGGLPFEVKVPDYKQDVLEAIEEGRRIGKDSSAKGYTDVNELFRELNAEDDQ